MIGNTHVYTLNRIYGSWGGGGGEGHSRVRFTIRFVGQPNASTCIIFLNLRLHLINTELPYFQ